MPAFSHRMILHLAFVFAAEAIAAPSVVGADLESEAMPLNSRAFFRMAGDERDRSIQSYLARAGTAGHDGVATRIKIAIATKEFTSLPDMLIGAWLASDPPPDLLVPLLADAVAMLRGGDTIDPRLPERLWIYAITRNVLLEALRGNPVLFQQATRFPGHDQGDSVLAVLADSPLNITALRRYVGTILANITMTPKETVNVLVDYKRILEELMQKHPATVRIEEIGAQIRALGKDRLATAQFERYVTEFRLQGYVIDILGFFSMWSPTLEAAVRQIAANGLHDWDKAAATRYLARTPDLQCDHISF